MTTSERDIAQLKHEARVRARVARASVDPNTHADAARRLAERMRDLPELQRAGGLVLAYAALPEEIDPAYAVAELHRRGLRTAYPRVEQTGILGLHLATEAQLADGRYGIREPIAVAPRVAPTQIDAVLVPGVAFDELCFRLGYGGGYYDRLLAQLRPGVARIGLAFDEQIVTELPCEEHDVQLDAVVTPRRVIRP